MTRLRKVSAVKKGTAVLLAACMAGAMLTGCGKKSAKKMDQTVHVKTQTAKAGTLSVSNRYIGELSPVNSVDVTPLVSGTVKKVNVKVGDHVKAGDVLCQFDDTAADFGVENAKNAEKTARAGKEAAKDQMDSAKKQSQGSLTQLETSIDGMEKQIAAQEKQLAKLKASKSKLKKASDSAVNAYKDAKLKYKTAQNLQVNFQAFLNANPDCQTTAGLEMAAAGDSKAGASTDAASAAAAAQKTATAQALKEALKSSGVTVEYLSDSGVEALRGNSDDAEKAATQASTAYSQTVSGITSLKQSIAQLKTQLSASKKSLKNSKDAMNSAGGNTDTYDAQIDSAKTGVDSAQYQKDLYKVTSPIDGVVEAVNVTKNEVAGQTPAFKVSGKDQMLVTFYVTEEVKNQLKKGQEVVVNPSEEGSRNTAAKEQQDVKGSITSIGNAVDASKGLFKVEAQIYTGSENQFSSGTDVTVSTVSESVSDQILIPYDAVYYENDQAYVYVVENGTAKRADVITGLYNDDMISVQDGISAGDQVVTNWNYGLKDGAKVVTK